jgi:hypothetical protein
MTLILKLYNRFFSEGFKHNLCAALLICGFVSLSQTTNTETTDIVQATNFTVPSSTAFNLLDVNPSQIHRPGYAKDLKLDWVIKDGKIASNIAIEAQPAWLFFYKNTDYDAFSKHNYIEKVLSSVSISAGTAVKDSINSLAWGIKFNLYSEKNPLYDKEYIDSIGNFIADNKLRNKIDSLQLLHDMTEDGIKKKEYAKQLEEYKKEYTSKELVHFKKIEEYKEKYKKDNWNKTIVDLGFGMIYNYVGESLTTPDSLDFRNRGGGIWVSGNIGIGKKILINSMIKYTKISDDEMASFGANIRYGGLNTNFFVEGLYTDSSLDAFKTLSISYGGEMKLKNLLILQFGLRTSYNRNMDFRNFMPIINLNYLLDD